MSDVISSLSGSLPPFAKLVIIVLAVVATAVIGSFGTTPYLGWYATLAKPALNPPNWLFGPAWTLLFALMAYAAWRIWKLPPGPEPSRAMLLFFVQLAFNAAWSWAFFASNSPGFGLVVIAPFLLIVVATTLAFLRADSVSGLLMLPYPLWVAFATYLNVGIWWLNRS
jgi:translocator protein